MPKWGINTGRGATHFEEKRYRNNDAAVPEFVWYNEAGWLPGVCATSRISYYLCCTQAGTGGQVKVLIKWTDNSATVQELETATINTNVLGDVTSGDFLTHSTPGTNITCEVIVIGGPTGYKYDLFLHAEHM